ncbi:ARM REPEAT PROTEIN INTERACTING WITH ABF2-like isoform X1 [Camellia sinensis]|uniref:ARM REPEAT PROTEIN INTERACTING WITH ABF2-like isoform X1 n=1 Tax=Camellia sinensis TaxID=4442 RepID=UPI001035CB4E|nr:ARM REPEAT PROTEIN INTERACTING WITH ABF2-like isoform X1 [Camellia sinensis]
MQSLLSITSATSFATLNSCRLESQRQATLLLGQFAATDSDCAHCSKRCCPTTNSDASVPARTRERVNICIGSLAQVFILIEMFLFCLKEKRFNLNEVQLSLVFF